MQLPLKRKAGVVCALSAFVNACLATEYSYGLHATIPRHSATEHPLPHFPLPPPLLQAWIFCEVRGLFATKAQIASTRRYEGPHCVRRGSLIGMRFPDMIQGFCLMRFFDPLSDRSDFTDIAETRLIFWGSSKIGISRNTEI